jgi:hypothetical protein
MGQSIESGVCRTTSRASPRRAGPVRFSDCPANKKRAAGGPAAKATGRHHNVREDISSAVAGRRCLAVTPARRLS